MRTEEGWRDESESAARLPEENRHQNKSSSLSRFEVGPAWHIPTSALEAGAMLMVSDSSKWILMNLMSLTSPLGSARHDG